MVYSGHMAGDTDMIGDLDLIPMLNSIEQMTRHFEALPGHPFGVQLDSGMNRLGMEPAEWAAVRDDRTAPGARPDPQPPGLRRRARPPDEPAAAGHVFRDDGWQRRAPASLAATGGVLLGEAYHFDLTRPGIGLYGGLPFEDAQPVVRLSLPVIQTRDVEEGEPVGYGNSWHADQPARIATVSGGYADGLSRMLSNAAVLFAGDVPCPVVGRVSMDLITVDITHLPDTPTALDVLCDAPDGRRSGRGRADHRLRDPDLAGRALCPALYRVRRHDPDRTRRSGRTLGPGACWRRSGGWRSIWALTLSHLVRPPFYFREFGSALLTIGYFSLPVVGLTTLFTGGALALQIYSGGARFNAEIGGAQHRRHRHGARAWARF